MIVPRGTPLPNNARRERTSPKRNALKADELDAVLDALREAGRACGPASR